MFKVYWGTAIFAALTLFSFQNCSKKTFNQDPDNDVYYSCHEELTKITTPVKLLFVIDISGSNNPYEGNTDPNKEVRGDSIQEFFDQYKQYSNFSWGIHVFAGNKASTLIGNNSSPEFTNSINTMQNAIDYFFDLADKGNTPYRHALALAHKAIQQDSTYTSETKYVVVFLSDGAPNPHVADATLQSDINDLLSIRPDQISFNTIYYGDLSEETADRLEMMADVGKGQFLDTNTNSTGKYFEISHIVNVPGVKCN